MPTQREPALRIVELRKAFGDHVAVDDIHRVQLMALGEIFHNLRLPDGSPRYGITANEELYESLERIYRFGQSTGEFRQFDTRVMAITHSSAVDNMFAYWAAYPEHDLDAHAR
ncbi:hypothetical protein ACFFR7_30350, partial [Nonomuraea dietziae]